MPDIEISIKELTKSFGPQTVLEDITFDIPKSKITLILGPSGTGKSVFLKHLVGLLKPDRAHPVLKWVAPTDVGFRVALLVPEQKRFQPLDGMSAILLHILTHPN
jgi:ABC-type Fe3+/spermidine/putrescine transport system ATPase subunit